jgi:hypothetical protein
MSIGLRIKKNNVLLTDLDNSTEPLTLNFNDCCYYDQANKELDLVPLVSIPPVGCKKVVNIYVDMDGKLAVDYEE